MDNDGTDDGTDGRTEDDDGTRRDTTDNDDVTDNGLDGRTDGQRTTATTGLTMGRTDDI